MKFSRLVIGLPTLFLLLLGCTESPEGYGGLDSFPPDSDKFHEQWYAGKAEITRYELKQARYGEIHTGDAVLVFVTEPFDTDKLVKNDDGQGASTSVMKLNAIRKFTTGIYDYSMMTSVFMPTDQKTFPHALKVTGTSQEWCGHTFMQLNRRGDRYQGELRSYFESEGEQDFEVQTAWLEDELMTQIRLNPNQLPTGEIEVLPAVTDLRLRHMSSTPQKAIATLSEDENQAGQMTYKLEYQDIQRTLSINFSSAFPHTIESWKETIRSGYGASANMLTTEAVRTHRTMTDYWSQNSVSDAPAREALGL